MFTNTLFSAEAGATSVHFAAVHKTLLMSTITRNTHIMQLNSDSTTSVHLSIELNRLVQ